MGLFLVMAMLKGKLETLEIGNITHYYQTGRHRDFIMFVVMISLFIKFGFFLFQSYLLDLKNTKFHRLILIPYLSTPMVSLVLLIKFYPLLIVSPSFEICLNIILALTMVWGTIGMIVINNLKEKTVYLNMLTLSMIVKVLQQTDFIWGMHISIMLIVGFCFNLCLYYAHYNANRENNVALITKVNKWPMFIVLFVYIILSVIFMCQLLFNMQKYLIWLYMFIPLFTLSSAHFFSQILFVEDGIKLKFFQMIIIYLSTICLGYFLRFYLINWQFMIFFVIVFLGTLKAFPLRFLYNNKVLNSRLQNIDFFAHIYDKIIANPVKVVGRWLTLLFDFMFIEKTIATMFSSVNAFTIRIFRKSARHWILYYVFNFSLAVAVILWCFIRNVK